jgi:hypothetical protein
MGAQVSGYDSAHEARKCERAETARAIRAGRILRARMADVPVPGAEPSAHDLLYVRQVLALMARYEPEALACALDPDAHRQARARARAKLARFLTM